jgi:hypothetical protein
MDRAARFETCDWEQPIHEGGYITMLLPEIQQARAFARLLGARAHLEIAEGKYDQAVRTFQTGYSQSRQVAQSPTIVSGLVGVTIADMMSYQVQQFIERPDAPNLYWALSTLPRPLVDMRLGGEAESNLLYLEFPELRDIDQKKLSPDAWRVLLRKIQDDVAQVESYISKWSRAAGASEAKATAKPISIEAIYPRAKRYLIEHGLAAAKVEAMPVAQAVLLYSVNIYIERSDAEFKWFFLPVSEADTQLQVTERVQRDAAAAERGIFSRILSYSVWPETATAAKEAETRCQWKIAVLRICEALRLHAAAHEGRWPEHLTDITAVPVPVNPYDGKPFVYERKGDKATLTCSERGPKYEPWRYEITLKQKPAP